MKHEMYWLNNSEKKVVIDFLADQFASACVAKSVDGEVRKTSPYTWERTSTLATKIGSGLEDIAIELTAFVRNVNDALAKEFGKVYTVWWHSDNDTLVGTFYLFGVGDNPVDDCTEQMRLLIGEEKPTKPIEVYELGKWVVEQIDYIIETRQFDGDIKALFDAMRRELSIESQARNNAKSIV